MGLSVNVLRHPLRLDRDIVVVPEGSSVREIIDHAGVSGAYVEINGHPVPVGMWDNVRPKGSAHVLVKSVAGDRGITRALGQIAVIAGASALAGPPSGAGSVLFTRNDSSSLLIRRAILRSSRAAACAENPSGIRTRTAAPSISSSVKVRNIASPSLSANSSHGNHSNASIWQKVLGDFCA